MGGGRRGILGSFFGPSFYVMISESLPLKMHCASHLVIVALEVDGLRQGWNRLVPLGNNVVRP